MRPYECVVSLPNNVSGDAGQFNPTDMESQLNFIFKKRNGINNSLVVEREPMRKIKIENPCTYNGSLNHSKSYFLNGEVAMTNGSFLSGFFVSEIADSNIVVGPYPLYEIDVDQIVGRGVSAVINLQTKSEIQERGVDTQAINQIYRSKGIHTIVHNEIDDTTEESLSRGIFEASKILD